MRRGFYIYDNRRHRRARTHMLRDGEGHAAGGGASQSAAGNNDGGNSGGASGTGNSGDNNSGLDFNPETFWQSPAAGDSGAPSEGSAGSGTQAAGTQGSQGGSQPAEANIGQRLATQLGALAFAPVFTEATARDIADGRLDSVNDMLSQMGRESVRNSVMMTAELMQAYGSHLMTQVQTMIDSTLGNRDNDTTLMSEFPQAAANPAIQPMIRSIFQQAMKHTGNSRPKAIEMTRTMLKFVNSGVGADLGLNDPPGNSGDNIGAGAASLVESLLSRE